MRDLRSIALLRKAGVPITKQFTSTTDSSILGMDSMDCNPPAPILPLAEKQLQEIGQACKTWVKEAYPETSNAATAVKRALSSDQSRRICIAFLLEANRLQRYLDRLTAGIAERRQIAIDAEKNNPKLS